MKQTNIKALVFVLVLLVVIAVLPAVVSLVGNWGESDEELSCGSVGRLVATAEAYASETGDGSVRVRFGQLNSDEGSSVSLAVRQGERWSVAHTVYMRMGQDRFMSQSERGPVCEALIDIAAFFGDDLGSASFGLDRAHEVQRQFDSYGDLGTFEQYHFIIKSWYKDGQLSNTRISMSTRS